MRRLFSLLYILIAKKLPGSEYPKTISDFFSFIRVFLLKRWAFNQVGKHITVHEDVLISSNFSINGGDNWGFGRGCSIWAMGGLTIGTHVMFGPNVTVITTNHRYSSQFNSYSHELDIKPVVIEDDVWIGANATILPGVIIGKGTIIGASSVVVKSIPPFSVAVGNPAKVVKHRI